MNTSKRQCTCLVPDEIHGTSCGWINARFESNSSGTIITKGHPMEGRNFNEWYSHCYRALVNTELNEINGMLLRILNNAAYVDYEKQEKRKLKQILLPDGSLAGPASAVLLKWLDRLYSNFNITMFKENEPRMRTFINGLQNDLKILDEQYQ